MYNVENKKPYVATYKEIFIGFVTFALILIVLYPKDLLEKQVLSEEANYDLSILYLKNMLKNDPGNEELMFNLAKQSLRGNKSDLAYRLLKLLKTSKNKEIREKAYLLSYKIAKESYYYLLKDNKDKEAAALLKEMRQLNRYIVINHLYTEENLTKLYEEAIFLNDKSTALFLLQKILKKEPSIKNITSAYYLALNLKRYEQALNYLDMLIEKEKKNVQKWKEAKYFILYRYKSPTAAEEFLHKEAQYSAFWKEKLALFFLSQKEYKMSAKTYMELFKESSDYNKRLHYWLKALKALQAGNHLKEASQLGYKYEKQFLKNRQARIFLLKLYLAANELQKANHLAKEILKLKKEQNR
jgi:hypothetical protein